MKDFPVIREMLKKMPLSNNAHHMDGEDYDVPTLIQYCKDKGFEEFDMPIAGINLQDLPFELESFLQFCNHVYRMEHAETKHPIILNV